MLCRTHWVAVDPDDGTAVGVRIRHYNVSRLLLKEGGEAGIAVSVLV